VGRHRAGRGNHAQGSRDVSAAEQLHGLAADYWEFRLREFPTLAHDVGDPRGRRDFFRESIADHARRAGDAAAFERRLAAIPLDALRGHDRDTHRLLARELAGIRTHFAFESHLRPFLFPEGPDTTVAFATQRVALVTREDADDYVARLATLPAYFAAREERLRAGVARGHRLPAVLHARVCASVAGHLDAPPERSAWFRPFATAPAGDARMDSARSDLARLVERELRPAYRRWLDYLTGDYAASLRPAVGLAADPDGEALYAFLAREYTTTDATPAEIHATGLDEVARIRAETEAVARRAGHADGVAGLRRRLETDPRFVARTKDELRERLEVLAKRIDRRIPEFFGRIPRMTYGIESMPEAQSAQLPPAYAQPSPPSRATAGVFWVSGLPDRCPAQMHVPLTLHEAWPGHLMHIALLQEMADLPAFRRYGMMGYTAYVEGWALYCEQLGHDLGLYGDPYAHYGQLEMEMWRAVRLVVDTGLHVGGWSRERAIAYMTEHLALPAATIEGEVDRYIGMPGQALAYKIGELRIRGLRRHAAATLGERFDLRAFHDVLSSAGPVTLDLLDEHVHGWIASVAGRAA
jgi:uncharacterized protein (DUF885 family)